MKSANRYLESKRRFLRDRYYNLQRLANFDNYRKIVCFKKINVNFVKLLGLVFETSSHCSN